jgi:NADPH:quinone reductase-like Zn-dependent oxidoreductase
VGDENQNNFFTNFAAAMHSVATRWTSILVNGVHTKRYFFFDQDPETIGSQLDVVRYMAEQKRINPIVDSVYNIEDYVAAIERFQQRNGVKYGKVILKITEDADQIKPS